MYWTRKSITITALVAAAIITCIVLTIPFIRVPYSSLENYTETEFKNEPYTGLEPYNRLEIQERYEIVYDGTPFSVPEGISIPFDIVNDNTRLIGSFSLPAPGGFYLYLSTTGRIVYEQLGSQGYIDLGLPPGQYKALVRERALWEGRIFIYLALQWAEEVEVTDYREVTEYRKEPVSVVKQRTVTDYRRASMWEIIFKR
jgi:hypothetical protein